MNQKKEFTLSEKRWIIIELVSGRLSYSEAMKLVEKASTNPKVLISSWKRVYYPEIPFTLPVMTEKERQKLEAAHKRMKELEKQLEEAQMKNIALNTMIDIAEDQLKIVIRKKSGPKQ
jgi:hypothetical protein